VGFEEDLLVLIVIDSNSEYKLERETSTGFTLLLYASSPPTPLPPSLFIEFLLLYNIMI